MRAPAIILALAVAAGHASAHAAQSEGTNKQLDTSQINQAGVSSSSETSGRKSQVSLGAPFAAEDLVATRFQMAPGFVEVTANPARTPSQRTELDIATVYAKTDGSGAQITPAEWQRDNDPLFIWERPEHGLDIAGYSYAIDTEPDDTIDTTGTSWSVADDPIETLSEGKRTFRVKALSTAGRSGNAASVEIWIDRTAPSILSTSPSPGGMLSTLTPSMVASVNDPHSGVAASSVAWLINGSAATVTVDPSNGQITVTRGSLREGSNALELRVSDLAGNAQTPLVWSVSADVTAPSGTVLINAGASMSTSAYVTLNLTATDATSGVSRMQLSNDPVVGFVEEPFSTVRTLWRLNAVRGSQRVYVKFSDAAGNMSDAVTDDILLTLIAPDTVIVSGPAGITPLRSASFTFACPEGDCQFSYSFDGAEWSPWSSETTAERDGLVFGNHYFAVKAAKESNGQDGIQPDEEDPVPADRTWIVGVEPTQLLVPRGNPIKLWRIE